MKRAIERRIVTILAMVSLLLFFSCRIFWQQEAGQAEKEGEERAIEAVFVTPYATEEGLQSAFWLKKLALEQKIAINWRVITPESWEAEKEAVLSGKNAPDLFINALETSDYARYPLKFENFAKYIGTSTPNIAKMFRETKNLVAAATVYTGEVFALPSYSALELPQSFTHSAKTVVFINQAWLKKLNLPIPETLDDFESTLRAFRENDCNEDGEATDEIPFDFYGWDKSQFSALMFLGSFGVQLTDGGKNGYFLEDEVVKNFFIDERYKTLLSRLAKWYKEGLIRDASLTSDYRGYRQRSHGDKDGRALVGIVIGKEETEQFGEKIASQYRVMLPPVAEADGERARLCWSYDNLAVQVNKVSLSAACAKKEAVIAFLDSLYLTENSIYSMFGDENFVATGENADFVIKNNIENINCFGEYGPHYVESGLSLEIPESYVYAQLERAQYQKLKVKKENIYPEIFLKYPALQHKDIAAIEERVRKEARAFAASVIRGEREIESDWGKYCARLAEIGIEKAIVAHQAAYNRYATK